jgi:uncharacterized protein (TIGR02646 family)
MIYVPKPDHKAPQAFLDAARDERIRVERTAAARRSAYPFTAYKNKSLKDVLEAIFEKKCAYCETHYAVGGYLEVEHYRPKNAYYWLAADWSNLLPSCKRCNNGKLTKFPLSEAARQARRKGQEGRESPLLLNPSDPLPARRPEKHLTFDANDGAVRARLVKGQPSPMGMKSIEVYRLTRPDLAFERKSWALRVWFQLLHDAPVSRRGLSDRERELIRLAEQNLHDSRQPYRALTREIMREARKTRRTRRRRT